VVASVLHKHPRILVAAALAVLIGAPVIFAVTNRATAQSAHAVQAVPVGVRTIEPRDVQLWSSFSGRLEAVDHAEIRPEVVGRITQVLFSDGQIVHQGDVLLVIDPRPYEAAVAKAKGDVATARANVALAKTNLDRATGLIKANAIARSVYDQSVNGYQVAVASVAVAEAALEQAQVDVDHAYVKAPISGRISRPEITVGNLVQTTPSAPLLASIVSNDGIYADFEVDEQTYVNGVRAFADTRGEEQKIPVEMTLQGTADHVYKGSIYSFDNTIDTGSGTIRARAKFANEDGSLVPGMFVSVKIGAGASRKTLLVPDRAIASDLDKKFVFVVGRGDKAEVRTVTLGAEVDGERVVLAGLKRGDRVIVDGVQHVALGAPVAVERQVASR